MNVVVDPQPNCVVNLETELPADQFSKQWQVVARKYLSHARIPGFRAGKAPISLVESRFAKEIGDEVQSDLINESIEKAVQQSELRALNIEVDESSILLRDDKTMRFRIAVITEPDFDLPDYKSIEIEIPRTPVDDESVEEAIKQFAEPHASYEAIEGRALEMGDYGVIDYEGITNGQPLSTVFPSAPAQLNGRRNAWILLSPSTLVPGFSDAIVGMNIGEERQFTLNVPASFPQQEMRGLDVTYTVSLKAINVRKEPELNDELASKIQPDSTMESLRTLVRERMEQFEASEFEKAKRNAVIRELNSRFTCELPEGAVANEVSALLRDIVRENQNRGISDDELRENEDQIVGIAKQGAQERVRTHFLLLRIAEAEKIEVTQTDLSMAVGRMAMQFNIPIKKLISDLQKHRRIQKIVDQIRMGKSLDLVVSNATVREILPPKTNSL